MERYHLYTWPDSQEFVGNDKCILIVPPKGKETEYDSSYMVPQEIDPYAGEDSDSYLAIAHPVSQAWADVPGVFTNYDDQTVFVPTILYDAWVRKMKIETALNTLIKTTVNDIRVNAEGVLSDIMGSTGRREIDCSNKYKSISFFGVDFAIDSVRLTQEGEVVVALSDKDNGYCVNLKDFPIEGVHAILDIVTEAVHAESKP